MPLTKGLTLYPYQKKGVRWLAERERGYLADEMGLGKTAQVILANRLAKKQGADIPGLWIVCPASVTANWENELEKWGWDGKHYIISYSSLIRRRAPLGGTPYSVVLDEAHYCKTPSAQRTKAALRLAANAPRAYPLSGTPMPNDPTELWPVFKYLWPERAKEHGITTAQQWMHKFCKVRATEWGPKPYAVRNGALLRKLLDGVMLRRRLEDVGLELPPLRVTTSYLPRDTDLGDALDDYQDYEGQDPDQVFTSTLRRLLGAAKAPRIARQIADELQEKAYPHIIVLYYHHVVGDVLRQEFLDRGISNVGFDGSTPQSMRQRAIDFFQGGNAQVFLAQQTAAQEGINLTRASEIVLVEPSWTPQLNAQAVKRIHRIGQENPCRARIFAVPGTLDGAIMGTLAQKTQMQQEVFGK